MILFIVIINHLVASLWHMKQETNTRTQFMHMAWMFASIICHCSEYKLCMQKELEKMWALCRIGMHTHEMLLLLQPHTGSV